MVSEIKKCFRYSFLYFFGFLFWSFLNNIEIRYNRKERKRADIANIYAVSAIIFFEVRAEADIRTSVVSSIYQVNSGVHISNHFFKGRIAAQQNRTECFHESIGFFLCFVFGLTTIIKFCIISHKSIAPALGSCIGILTHLTLWSGQIWSVFYLARRLIFRLRVCFFRLHRQSRQL